MLNEPYWIQGRGNVAPFVAAVPPRTLTLLVCPRELDAQGSLELLAALGRTRPHLDVLASASGFGGSIEADPSATSVAYHRKDGSAVRTFVYGDWWRRLHPEYVEESGLGREALERTLFLANEASRRDWVDGLVIDFPEPLIRRWGNVWARAPVLMPDQALALAGLYLRASGDYTLSWENGASIHEGTERFYRIAAAALVPRLESWLAIAMSTWKETGNQTLFELADGVAVRFGRALRARDYLHVRERAAAPEAVWGDALYFFESVLVCLQGSLDGAARFLHHLYELPGSPRAANWCYRSWWKRLTTAGAPVDAFRRERLIRLGTLVGELRNAVHGAVLSDELRRPVSPGEHPMFVSVGRTGIALEPTLATRVADAATGEGGTARWLVQHFEDGTALLDPWSYCERAVETVAKALSSVVGAVAAEHDPRGELGATFSPLWLGTPQLRETARAVVGIGRLPRR